MSNTVSNHVVDTNEAIPTFAAIPKQVGQPVAAALDAGYFTPKTMAQPLKRAARPRRATFTWMEAHGIEPYIATGREGHRRDWKTYFAELPDVPPDANNDASPRAKMTYKLQTQLGRSIYRLRKCTVSLRPEQAVARCGAKNR